MQLFDQSDICEHNSNMFTKKELEEYTFAAIHVLSSIDLVEMKKKKITIETKLSEPTIWSDNKKASAFNQELSQISSEINNIEKIKYELEDLEVACDLNDEVEFIRIKAKLDKAIESFQNKQFLNGPFDNQGVFLSIFAGAGGLDAQDWASILCAMYQTFSKNQNWDCRLVNLSASEEAGIKSATLEILGENAYGLLKEEAGVHRLVRISPFNSGGTRETSFAMVEVVPNNLSSKIEIEIDDKDIRIDTFMSSGKGGQGVNTTYSAVRIVHLPTNISVQCQDERSQIMNKARAMEILKNKLAVIELQKQKEFERELKGTLVSNEWGSQIRNYVFHPYKLVKDLRSGWETTDIAQVVEYGQILPVIWSVKKARKEIDKV
jgi:peptide chain release factor 2